MKDFSPETLRTLTLLLAPLLAPTFAMVQAAGTRRRSDPGLCDAASAGDLARLRALLAEGASADSADEDGTTALMAGAFAGETRVVRTLLEQGADPNLQDESGLTALMNAVIGNGEMDLEGAHPVYREIVELLLDAGADPALEDQDGSTAADHAVSYELDELARLLAGD